jgi:hypothetical protein
MIIRRLIPAALLMGIVFSSMGVFCNLDRNHHDDETGSSAGVGDADLSALSISDGLLTQPFSTSTLNYTARFITAPSVTIRAFGTSLYTSIYVNNVSVLSGVLSNPIALTGGANTITVKAQYGMISKTYTITANKLYQQAYAKASNTGAGDSFGCSVAIDGNTMGGGRDRRG